MILLVVAPFASSAAAAAATGQMSPSLWPQPVSLTQHAGHQRLVTGSEFSCKVSGTNNDILEAACRRYEGYISAQSFLVSRRAGFDVTPNGVPLVAIEVSATDVASNFGLRTNESYSLSIAGTGAARLHAAHVVGVLRGLETFFQLLHPLRPAMFTVTPVDVVDAPRWSHRGLLVDTGRHFYPVEFLKHIIEGMAMDKLSGTRCIYILYGSKCS